MFGRKSYTIKEFLKKCDFSNNISIKSSLIKQEINSKFKYANKDYLENWKINFNNFISANIRVFYLIIK